MKTHVALAVALLALAASTTAFAVLDVTAEECSSEYGAPVAKNELHSRKMGRYLAYLWYGMYVEVVFAGEDLVQSRSVGVWYEPESVVTGSAHTNEISAEQIEHVLALNAGGSGWERTRRGWVRKDRRAVAREFKHRRDGAKANTLLVRHVELTPNGGVDDDLTSESDLPAESK